MPITRRPELEGTRVGDRYGLTYDKDTIRSKFDRATETEFQRRQKEHDMARTQYDTDLHRTQRTALDTLRQGRHDAIATGASRGMQAAQELSTVLGLGAEGAEGATQLAQDQALLGDREAEAYTQNLVQALEESNRLRSVMGELDHQRYAADTQLAVGELDHDARIEAAIKQAEAAEYGADRQLEGTRHTADQHLTGTKYSADRQLEGVDLTSARDLTGTQYAADQRLTGTQYTADQNLAGTQYTADQNLAGQRLAASAQIQTQKISSAAQKEAARIGNERPDIAAELAKFKQDGNEGAYVATLTQAGTPADTAREMWEGLQEDQAPAVSSVPQQDYSSLSSTVRSAGQNILYNQKKLGDWIAPGLGTRLYDR